MKTPETNDTPDKPGQPAADTAPLFFVRCQGDGSWLTTIEPLGQRFALHPASVARITREQYLALFGNVQPIYVDIPAAKAIHEHVSDAIRESSCARLPFFTICHEIAKRSPFRQEKFEVAMLLSAMVRRGALELRYAEDSSAPVFKIGTGEDLVGDELGTVRIFIKDGLVQDLTGLPEGVTVRVIDCDTEGASDDDTHILEGDDLPPWEDGTDDEERSNGPKRDREPVRGFIGEYTSVGKTAGLDRVVTK